MRIKRTHAHTNAPALRDTHRHTQTHRHTHGHTRTHTHTRTYTPLGGTTGLLSAVTLVVRGGIGTAKDVTVSKCEIGSKLAGPFLVGSGEFWGVP
jgi:hypothetical protein